MTKNMIMSYDVQDGEVFEYPDGYSVKLVAEISRNDFETGTKIVVWLSESMPEYIMIDGDDEEGDEGEREETVPEAPTEPPTSAAVVVPMTEQERIEAFAKAGGHMIVITNVIPQTPVPVAESPLVADIKQYLRDQDQRRTA